MAIVRYASLMVKSGEEIFGTAELVNGSGYLFRKDGDRTATLVSYKDPELMLYGLVDLVAQADAADGDRVRRCSQTLDLEDGQLDLFATEQAGAEPPCPCDTCADYRALHADDPQWVAN